MKEEAELELQTAQSATALELQLETVQREAEEVLQLCDSATVFTNEVRAGLLQARVSMGEQRAALESVLHTVEDRLRSAEQPQPAEPKSAPDSSVRRLPFDELPQRESDADGAYLLVGGDGTSDTVAKKERKIQWLMQKLQNVETACADRVRCAEEELRIVRTRHHEAQIRIKELAEQVVRAGTTRSHPPAAYAPGSSTRSKGAASESGRGQDASALLVRAQRLCRDLADINAQADSEVELQREHSALQQELQDLEHAVTLLRDRERAKATQASNAQLRVDIRKQQEELRKHHSRTDLTPLIRGASRSGSGPADLAAELGSQLVSLIVSNLWGFFCPVLDSGPLFICIIQRVAEDEIDNLTADLDAVHVEKAQILAENKHLREQLRRSVNS